MTHSMPVPSLSTEMTRRKRRIRTLDGVIEPPIETVEVQVHKGAVRPDATHRDLGVAKPLVASEGDVSRILLRPGTRVSRAQYDAVELRDRRITVQWRISEDGRFELAGAVLFLEFQPQGPLGAVRAVGLEGAIDLKPPAGLSGINQLHRGGPASCRPQVCRNTRRFSRSHAGDRRASSPAGTGAPCRSRSISWVWTSVPVRSHRDKPGD